MPLLASIYSSAPQPAISCCSSTYTVCASSTASSLAASVSDTQSPVQHNACLGASGTSTSSSTDGNMAHWLSSNAPGASILLSPGKGGAHGVSASTPGSQPGRSCDSSPSSAVSAPDTEMPGIVKELGVSLDSLQRLLTGDCSVESQQPVWMVVNLQGKIKGSYTASKMLEFSRRGTLSSAQLVLGIDKDLPYMSRQELAFYRRIDYVLQAVHAGAVYRPLTQEVVGNVLQQGRRPQEWQPLCADTPATAIAALNGESVQSHDSSTHAAAVAADARLQMALQRLCGGAAPLPVVTDEAASSAAATTPSESPGLSRASSVSCAAAIGQHTDSGLPSGVDAAAAPAATATGATPSPAASASLAAGSVEGTGQEPVWEYINHLGWCRGPFPGEKMIQAHLCGRLPRDTLVVCHNPELPPNLLCSDVPYFFRPLGALLDNVANGWRYKPVDWKDITQRGHVKSVQQQQQQQQQQQLLPDEQLGAKPWTPLMWEGRGEPVPLVNAQLLQPPKNIPAVQPAPGTGALCAAWALHGSSGSSGSCVKVPRRRRVRQQVHQPRLQFGTQAPQHQAGPGGQADALLAGVQASFEALGISSEPGWQAAIGATGPVCADMPATSSVSAHYAHMVGAQAGGQGDLQWQGIEQAQGYHIRAMPGWDRCPQSSSMLAPQGIGASPEPYVAQQQQQQHSPVLSAGPHGCSGATWLQQPGSLAQQAVVSHQQLQGSSHLSFQLGAQSLAMPASLMCEPSQPMQVYEPVTDSNLLLQLLLQQQQQQQQLSQTQLAAALGLTSTSCAAPQPPILLAAPSAGFGWQLMQHH